MRIAVFLKNLALKTDKRLLRLLDVLYKNGCEFVEIHNRKDILALSENSSSSETAGGKTVDILLSIGGDGTFLSAAACVGNSQIPILGLNLGRLGFLSEYEPGQVPSALFTKDYLLEDRALLFVKKLEGTLVNTDTSHNAITNSLETSTTTETYPTTITSPLTGATTIDAPSITNLTSPTTDANLPDSDTSILWPYCLNELTVHRAGPAMLGIDVSIDGNSLPTYWADGILIATASGSTAYSLSVGGPICSPDSKLIIIAPIAPHNLNLRPLIVPDTKMIELTFRTRERVLMCSMDNRSFIADNKLKLQVSLADFFIKRVRLKQSSFINALKTKLFWGEDIRNDDSKILENRNK